MWSQQLARSIVACPGRADEEAVPARFVLSTSPRAPDVNEVVAGLEPGDLILAAGVGGACFLSASHRRNRKPAMWTCGFLGTVCGLCWPTRTLAVSSDATAPRSGLRGLVGEPEGPASGRLAFLRASAPGLPWQASPLPSAPPPSPPLTTAPPSSCAFEPSCSLHVETHLILSLKTPASTTRATPCSSYHQAK